MIQFGRFGIQIIDDLRRFEIGFNEIRKIKEKLLCQINWDSLLDIPEYVEEHTYI